MLSSYQCAYHHAAHTYTCIYQTIFTDAFFITKPTSLVHLTNLGFLQLPSRVQILLGQCSNFKKHDDGAHNLFVILNIHKQFSQGPLILF
jgi:hypothetical protein